MLTTQAAFWTGPNGQLFCIARYASKTLGYVVYLPPLFEDANRNRHVYTRSAIQAAELGLHTVIFDNIGTGDSQGVLADVELHMWQSEIIALLTSLKIANQLPITLVACHSAALLLSPEVLAEADAIQLWHPEFNGKKFVQQFKRLAMINKMSDGATSSDTSVLEIAGYQVSTQLLTQLSEQSFTNIQSHLNHGHWFELIAEGENISPTRANQLALLKSAQPAITIDHITDCKHWQATELVIPENLLLRSKAALGQVAHE